MDDKRSNDQDFAPNGSGINDGQSFSANGKNTSSEEGFSKDIKNPQNSHSSPPNGQAFGGTNDATNGAQYLNSSRINSQNPPSDGTHSTPQFTHSNQNENFDAQKNPYNSYPNGGSHYPPEERNRRPEDFHHEPTFTNISPAPPEPEQTPDKNFKILVYSMAGVLLLFILGLGAYGLYTSMLSKNPGSHLFGQSSSQHENASSTNSLVNPNAPSLQIQGADEQNGALSAEQVYASAAPSVVGVVIYEPAGSIISEPKGEGSGIVISEDGYIVTNSHVIGDSKHYNVQIVTIDGTEYSASVVGYDTQTDLAVVKADASGLTPATFGDSEKLSVGAWVSAIGNPGGIDFAGSMTRGIVSAVNRDMGSSLVKYIQTDAAINPGNSGGALLNMYGQVIGINTSKIVATGFEGMGFSIAINDAKPVIDDLIKQGYVSGRVRLGITGKVVSEYQSKMFGVPQGIIISEIADESDLEAQGVTENDIITKVNGTQITSFSNLQTELNKLNPGDTATLTIYRQASKTAPSSTFEVKVTLLEDKGETQK